MTLAGALGDGDDLFTGDILIELGFSLATEPPVQGGDAGSVTQDNLMFNSPLVDLGTPTDTPNQTESG